MASGTDARAKEARENPNGNGVENLGRKDMRFRQAEHLHAQRRVGREQRIGQRD